MSHERMLNSERQLEAEMRALLRRAELIHAQKDGQYGKGKRDCPTTIWFRGVKLTDTGQLAEQHRIEYNIYRPHSRSRGVRPGKSYSNEKRPDHPINSHKNWRNKGIHIRITKIRKTIKQQLRYLKSNPSRIDTLIACGASLLPAERHAY